MRWFALVPFVGGCSSNTDSLDLAHRDPRCVAACPETTPQIEGVGDVCDLASRVECLDECGARIYEASSTGATCLTEDACFAPGGCGRDTSSVSCGASTCTIMGWAGSCS